MTKEISNNKRIAKNTLMLYTRTLLLMFISLYTSRVVLGALGIEDFGIYNIVGGVVVLFTFINSALSTAVQRFLNFELGKKCSCFKLLHYLSIIYHNQRTYNINQRILSDAFVV